MKTQIGTNISLACQLLEQGEVVAIPTETVYGLAANALNQDAVLKIFKAKNRPHFNPLIIHLADWKDAGSYTAAVPDMANQLARHFSPGPITFLLPKKEIIPDLVTAGSPKVAVRIPAHPLTLQLLRLTGFPLAAPSANPFGYVSPTSASHVWEGLAGKIPYILDGGTCQVGLESTIVDFDGEEIIIRRQGGVSVEDIQRVAGRRVSLQTETEDHPVAPGLLKSHYATQTPLYLGDVQTYLQEFSGKKICVIDFGPSDWQQQGAVVFNLSEAADMDEAAKNLFRYMREADHCGADVIIARLLPGEGLGNAINDRLRRARHDMK